MAISNYRILGLRLFVDFLKKEGCYQAYKANIYKQDLRWEIMRFVYSPEYIRKSFYSWESTPQGYEYWKKIDIRWRKYFKQHAKKVKKYSTLI